MKSKINNAIFGAAPAVMFVCSAISTIAGAVGFITTRSSAARASMNLGIGGMALSVLINRWDKVVDSGDSFIRPGFSKDCSIDATTSEMN